MQKSGQNKQKDPNQVRLRERKKRWNKASIEFIKRLIAFKKGLNGRGEPSFGLPVSDIKDPFPKEVSSFLSEVSANFEQLATEALQIEQEQAQYSQNRRKPAAEGAPTVASNNHSMIKLSNVLFQKWSFDE